MGLIVMARMWDPAHEADEFDYCSLCSRTTTLLISVRIGSALADICGQCINDLKIGYDAMMHERMQFELRARSDR